QAGPGESQPALAGLQTAGQAEAAQSVPKVDMGMVQPRAKETLDERKVEGSAVIGHQQQVVPHVAHEVVEVLTVDVVADGPAIVEGDGRYLVPGGKAGRLDVDESA